MRKNVNVKTISTNCEKCKGRLFTEDQKKREAAALSAFGIIPNDCVNDEKGACHCPFANGVDTTLAHDHHRVKIG